jgi:phosphopantothenoylcysteine decarboxylase/phosphopantothenate--cysteine ligase
VTVSKGRLVGRTVTLAVTGSIAAYKAVLVARLLLKEGARLRVILSRGATEFVGGSTFSGLTGEPAWTEIFDPTTGGERHVALAAESDLVAVVPATADVLARFAAGRADDLVAATVLCAACPVLVAPAMHPSMWHHPATARNVKTLRDDGRVEFVGPVDGEVASGDRGLGRLAEPDVIVERIVMRLTAKDLGGRRVVVTAGPTVEDVDAVRFVSNRSSGKMGFAIAERAAARGATVTLVAGPVTLATPTGVTRVDVRNAVELRAAVHAVLGPGLTHADVLVMAAAVGDFRAKTVTTGKLKRGKASDFTLELVQNPDILAEIGQERRAGTPLLVGFAVETGTDGDVIAFARGKLASKRVDMVVANHAAESMGREDNRVHLVGKTTATTLDVMPKRDVADRILDDVLTRLAGERAVTTPERAPAPKKSAPRRTKAKR